MVKDRRILVLYTSSICNLKCVYCYIDKNPALVKIDEILKESFKGDYYFEFTKKMFPDPLQLNKIEFWGGEPSIGLDRAIYTIDKIIQYYPGLNEFMMSTNLTLPNFCDIFLEFLNMLGSHPSRGFVFNLQLSIDGPEYINDASRGVGTTQKFLDNYLKLIKIKVPDNVKLSLHFKPTMSTDTIRKLQTKQSVLEYYTFLDKLVHLVKLANTPNITMFPTVPNTACPSPHTKKDGLDFANLCKICNEIEDEGLASYFTEYTVDIMPFRNAYNNYNELDADATIFNGGMCGVGKSSLGLLPNNLISCCHSGFVDLISDYKIECSKNTGRITSLESGFLDVPKNRLTLTLEEFSRFESVVENYYTRGVKVKNSNSAAFIKMLAEAGQVEEKLSDMELALKAANFVSRRYAYCIRDNINSTGCIELQPIGMYRLLLNGAMEEILR